MRRLEMIKLKLRILEPKNPLIATFVNQLSEKINDLKKDVKEISTSDLDHSDRIIVLEKSLTSISNGLSTLESNFNAYQARIDLSVNFDPKEVYFNYGPKKHVQGENGVMKFDEDRGSGKDHSYDPNTGYFTVKYEGLYFFSLSFLRWAKQSTTSTWADIKIGSPFYINPQAPVAQKVADEVVFRHFRGEGVEFC